MVPSCFLCAASRSVVLSVNCGEFTARPTRAAGLRLLVSLTACGKRLAVIDPHVIELFDVVKIGTKVTVTRASLVSGEQLAPGRRWQAMPDG